jgi:hypothetical protein
MTLHPIPLNFLIYEGHFFFFFISALCRTVGPSQVYFAGEEKSPISDASVHALFHVQECIDFLFNH